MSNLSEESETESGEIVDFDSEQRYHPDPRDRPDAVRRNLAYYLLALVALTVTIIVCSAVYGAISIDDAEDLGSAFVTPLIAVLGTVVGFFFGSFHR